MGSPSVRASRTTLSDLAADLGLSRATVSKALNNRTDVSEETRRRVQARAYELHYQPTVSASRSPSIAVVADGLIAMYTLQVLSGISDECQIQDLTMTLTSTTNVPGTKTAPLSDQWMRRVAANGFQGILLITHEVPDSLINMTAQLGLSLVVIDPLQSVSPDVLTIGATNWNGALAATRHLLGLGHKRIAYVQGPKGSLPSVERYEGYLSALRQVGLKKDDSQIIGDDFTFECGLESGRELLSRPAGQRPTAVFCGSDASALGIIEATREAGLRVPEDLSVVGFDNTFLAISSAPRLTTVSQPMHEMGAAAVRALVSLHAGTRPSGPMRFETSLIIRDSTAAPREFS